MDIELYEAAEITFSKNKVEQNEYAFQQAWVQLPDELNLSCNHKIHGALSAFKRVVRGEHIYVQAEEALFLQNNLGDMISSITYFTQTRSHLDVYKCPRCGKSNEGGKGVYKSWQGSDICDECEPDKSQYELHT